MHVVFAEDLDRTIPVVGRVGCRRPIRDCAAAVALERRQAGPQVVDRGGASFDDDLEGDDFVPRGQQPDGASIPDRVLLPLGMREIVALHLHPVVHSPDAEPGAVG